MNENRTRWAGGFATLGLMPMLRTWALFLVAIPLMSCSGGNAAPEFAPIQAPESVCSEGSTWNGRQCVRTLVVTEVTCPAGTHRTGDGCAAAVSTNCSAGLHFVAGQGCVPDLAAGPVASGDFEDRGATFLQRSVGLVWQKQPAGTDAAHPHGQTMNWEAAKTYCRTLSLDGRGWTLPTRAQLHALYGGKASGGNAFPGMDAKMYWSSSLVPSTSSHAYAVDFNDGKPYGDDIVFSKRVRCVR